MAVEGEGEAVDGVVPGGGLGSAEEEVVAVEEDAEGLDPGEVAGEVGVAFADEVGVDVEVLVGDQAEVGVLLAVEVERYPVATHEAGVLAHCAGPVAVCTENDN